ncbi:nucleotidyltransferase domain-containing protein [Kitasatospora viridis]|uniref:Nucleotidyltransferase-like protein n=1 Tax=Kitasatospora viridis TaxID=281105 RepID=A0A561UAE3_9ACTN|nr:nucleotidyltransferase domain-containing protein [Kitasatospora viridis]TWF96323.1 nucleotidyltransferase-like protein [Kitasatospora viridis]
MGGDAATEELVRRFAAGLAGAVPVLAVWAHGSLALGDYQPGRSDLDLLAVLERALEPAERERLVALHKGLEREFPPAAKLHCTYLLADRLGDPALDHLTWAHRELFARPVTPVTRRELELGGLCYLGPPPGELLPPVGEAELRAFIRRDLSGYWLPATRWWVRWLRDDWVDVGLFTLARATATLRGGGLLTKSQALAVLPEFGVSPALLADLSSRRAGRPVRTGWRWRSRRAAQARRVLRLGIRKVLAEQPN